MTTDDKLLNSILLEMLKSQRGGKRILREIPVKIIISDVVLRAAVEQAHNEGRDEVVINLQSPQGGCLTVSIKQKQETPKRKGGE